MHQFSRNELIFGKKGMNALRKTTVAVIGLGGVGSHAAEALVRSGVGKLILVDKDVVDITNINRQIQATLSTVGQVKVDAMRVRIKEINPDCQVVALQMFYTETTYEQLFAEKIDYLIDAADTLSYKIHIIIECLNRKTPIISVMGAANKLDPTKFRICDISKTKEDPVAKIVRTSLRKKGINSGVPVVFSDEKVHTPCMSVVDEIGDRYSNIRKQKLPPASNAFVPPVAGLVATSWVIKQILSSDLVE